MVFSNIVVREIIANFAIGFQISEVKLFFSGDRRNESYYLIWLLK